MAKRMLIDATHPEETRVVVLNGNRLEEFDFESSTKKQVKGNIYLAKITRVEPSLQAAFVEYGGNRHGFLAFSEIHPDYYRIPVADRGERAGPQFPEADGPEAAAEPPDEGAVPLEDALPEPVPVVAAPDSDDHPETEIPPVPRVEATDEAAADSEAAPVPGVEATDEMAADSEAPPVPRVEATDEAATDEAAADAGGHTKALAELPWEDGPFDAPAAPDAILAVPDRAELAAAGDPVTTMAPPRADEAPFDSGFAIDEERAAIDEERPALSDKAPAAEGEESVALDSADLAADPSAAPREARLPDDGEIAEAETIETLGGDEFDEAEGQRSRVHRHYKIQEVIKRRQIMLVQVTKEERGNKGAALTTYLSLAGRYCVLMPNTARGGGVSRKITSLGDRRRLKDILEELDIPEGMGVIVRTAGAERSKAEIKRDYEYLLRLWNEIRELTLRSTAPALIYEEGDLIKRSIRDLYTRDLDEVLVEGEDGYRTAKAFMKMLMPSHAKRVQPYRDPQIGLLHRFQVESQIDAIHSPIVQLRSGGYIVINQTEALVAIDVNSGRSTRERNIEETALRTNLEAAEEIARQLRLRDLAGLIVIDFIDMEEHRNQGAVERRLKEALKNDRARIQVGRISPFGLLEMSRQRLRPSLVEASTQPCPHCGGTGFIRSTESTALYVLRSIEEEGMRRRSAEVCIYVPTTVALYILNHKRESLVQLETRYGIHVLVARDDTLIPPAFRLERLRVVEPGETVISAAPLPLTQAPEIDEETDEDADETAAADDVERRGQESEEERGRVRRRRRRRRRHEDERGRAPAEADTEAEAEAEEGAPERIAAAPDEAGSEPGDDEDSDAARQRRRRGRRGGRRRGRREEGSAPGFDIDRPAAESVEIVAVGSGSPDDAAAPSGIDQPASPDEIWSTERAVAGPVIEMTTETASLPAISGDVMPIAAPPAGNGAAEVAPLFETALEAAPTPPADGNGHDNGASRLVEPAHNPIEGGASPAEQQTAGEPEAAPPGGEPDLEPQPEPELEPVAGPASQPNQVVQEVTNKPEHPRRGWWQRLIQS